MSYIYSASFSSGYLAYKDHREFCFASIKCSSTPLKSYIVLSKQYNSPLHTRNQIPEEKGIPLSPSRFSNISHIFYFDKCASHTYSNNPIIASWQHQPHFYLYHLFQLEHRQSICQVIWEFDIEQKNLVQLNPIKQNVPLMI
jgi:hypothetical protein